MCYCRPPYASMNGFERMVPKPAMATRSTRGAATHRSRRGCTRLDQSRARTSRARLRPHAVFCGDLGRDAGPVDHDDHNGQTTRPGRARWCRFPRRGLRPARFTVSDRVRHRRSIPEVAGRAVSLAGRSDRVGASWLRHRPATRNIPIPIPVLIARWWTAGTATARTARSRTVPCSTVPVTGVRPSFADGLAGGGGITVWPGAFLIALDIYADSGDGWTGALIFVAFAALAIVALFVAGHAVQPGCMSVLVLSVPTIYGFLIFPTTDSFADVRVSSHHDRHVARAVRRFEQPGRPILLGLVAAVFYVWMVAEVTDTDMYRRTRAERSGCDARRAAGLVRPPGVTLDDLDSSDPAVPRLPSRAPRATTRRVTRCGMNPTSAATSRSSRAPVGGDPDRRSPARRARARRPKGWVRRLRRLDGQTEDGLEITPQNPLDETPLDADEDHARDRSRLAVVRRGVTSQQCGSSDRRALTPRSRPLVIPAVGAEVAAAGSRWPSGSRRGRPPLHAFGVAIGVIGFFARDRRFMAWGGGVIASVGADRRRRRGTRTRNRRATTSISSGPASSCSHSVSSCSCSVGSHVGSSNATARRRRRSPSEPVSQTAV